jgi:peptide chain release factor 1
MDSLVYVFSGRGVKEFFEKETGGHRWHRVPPTEKRGRVHTSSITVVVLDNNDYQHVDLYPHEVKREYTRGSGPGGQHRNKTESCVNLTHIPTGITARIDGRHQHKNELEAMKILTERVNDYYRTGFNGDIVEERRNQVGKGSRGDKRRTYRVQDGVVLDHITNKSGKYKDILRGKVAKLH